MLRLLQERLGISDFIIGLSVVALGTSFPEIFVGISSIVNNNEELALGTIVGSNISNIALIFGVSCIGYSSWNKSYIQKKLCCPWSECACCNICFK